MNIENSIEVRNVYKSFKIYHDKARQLKDAVIFHKFGRKQKVTKRLVLDDISFDVRRGEAIALIGRNGCGKSTTLKLLTRILHPDQGTIEIKGRVASLIELGAGFHPDMTGRENIYINASIFGIKAKEVEKRIDDIITFSELEEYIDSPVRTYSSGMYMRLAFAVAINVNADVLLIDEILAVGDASFQAKCFKKIIGLKESGVTIVLVSHSLGQIEKICDRVIWIEGGRIKEEGDTDDVCQHYTLEMDQERINRERMELEKKQRKIIEREEKQKEEEAKIADEIEPTIEVAEACSILEEQAEKEPEVLESNEETAEAESSGDMNTNNLDSQEEEFELRDYKIFDNERPFEMLLHNDVSQYARIDREVNGKILIQSIDVLERENNILQYGEKLVLRVCYLCVEEGNDIYARCVVRTLNHAAVGMSMSPIIGKCIKGNENEVILKIDTSHVAPGKYVVTIVLFDLLGPGKQDKYDTAYVAVGFEVVEKEGDFLGWKWSSTGYGYMAFDDVKILEVKP